MRAEDIHSGFKRLASYIKSNQALAHLAIINLVTCLRLLARSLEFFQADIAVFSELSCKLGHTLALCFAVCKIIDILRTDAVQFLQSVVIICVPAIFTHDKPPCYLRLIISFVFYIIPRRGLD